MIHAGSSEEGQTGKAHPVLSSFDAALTKVGETLHDLAGLEQAVAELSKVSVTGLAGLSAADLSAADLEQAKSLVQKMRRLEQNLQLRGSILTGFSLQLKELIEA